MREGWETIKLESVSAFQNGFAFKSKTFKSEGVPVVRITNIQDDKIDLSKIVYIKPSDYNKDLSVYEIVKGDLLIAMSGATTGKIGIYDYDETALLNQRVGKFIPNEKILKRYLFYFLSTNVEESLKISAGSAQPNLSTEQIKKFQIPIPPLEEQHQIVQILDKAFSAIDQATANLARNRANANELFQSKLNEIFGQRGEGWEEKKLGEVSKIMYGHTSKVVSNGNAKYLRITDIQNGNVDWEKVPNIKIKNADFDKYQLYKGNIVFARTGATTGKSFLVNNSPKSIFASYLIRVECNLEIIEPQFLYLFFQSGIYWKLVNKGISGSAQGGFNATKLGEMEIHFPQEKKEQLKYVEVVKEIEKPLNELIINLEIKIADLKHLKKSLLEKAFSGALTGKEEKVTV